MLLLASIVLARKVLKLLKLGTTRKDSKLVWESNSFKSKKWAI
jgi:hypothetical protein